MKYVLIVASRASLSWKTFEFLLRALKEQGFYAFGIHALVHDGPEFQVFRLDDSLEHIDIERIEKMCAEASK